MFNCARCQRLVVICRRCDRGQRYCSADCAQGQRRRSVRDAGRRYQRSPLGARNNAARQKRWRLRFVFTVTHHTSQAENSVRQEPPDENTRKESGHGLSNPMLVPIPAGESGPRCDFCGRVCGSYTRLGTLGAERRRGWRVSCRR